MAMPRRTFLVSAAAVASAAVAALFTRDWTSPAQAAEGNFPVSLSADEWRKRLAPMEYSVLREEATESPFSSPLNANKKAGIYSCAGCANPVYSSKTKFESGTGWPSFWAPVSQSAIGTKSDYALIYPRTEVHCARCGGHLGHIFDDGPKPTGKRHCLNGVALNFKPGSTEVG